MIATQGNGEFSGSVQTLGRYKKNLLQSDTASLRRMPRPVPLPRDDRSCGASKSRLKNFANQVQISDQYENLPSASQLGFPQYATLNFRDSNGLMAVIRNVEIALENCRGSDAEQTANSLKFLAHACFKCAEVKEHLRKSGGIDVLIGLLEAASYDINHYALATLMNVSYSSRANKIYIMTSHGIPAITRFFNAETPDTIILKALKLMWNLSAQPELQREIMKYAVAPIVKFVVMLYAKLLEQVDKTTDSSYVLPALGTLGNLVAEEREEDRNFLRDTHGLVWSLVSILSSKLKGKEVPYQGLVCCLHVLQRIVRNHVDSQPNTVAAKDLLAIKMSKRKPPPGKSSGSQDAYMEIHVVRDADGKVVLEKLQTIKLICDFLKMIATDSATEEQKNKWTLETVRLLNVASTGVTKFAENTRKVVLEERCIPLLTEFTRATDPNLLHSTALLVFNLSKSPECVLHMGDDMASLLARKLSHEERNGLAEQTVLIILKAIKPLLTASHIRIMKFEKSGGIRLLLLLKVATPTCPYSDRVNIMAGVVLEEIWMNKKARKFLKKAGFKKQEFQAVVKI